MSDHELTPEDPEWVDAIVRRAMERAASEPALPDDAPEPVTPRPDPIPAARTAPVSGEHPERPSVPPIVDAGPRTPRPRPDGADASAVDEEARLPRAEDFASSYPLDDLDGLAAQREDAGFDTALAIDRERSDDLDDDDDASVGHRTRAVIEWGAVVLGALAVALLIKTFLMQAYYIPSPSMVPTLEVNDRVLVNKLSFAFGDISRGDLVVFHRPPTQAEGEDDLIKRVIALGGETVEIRDGDIYIVAVGADRSQKLIEPYLPEGVTTERGFQPDVPNCVGDTNDGTTCTVPEGSILVLGDNRSNSKDGRWFGPIDEDLVVGRAFLRVWPLGRLGFL